MKMKWYNKPKQSELNREELPMHDNDKNHDVYHHTYNTLDDSIEEAEESILSKLEAQARRTRAGSDGFRPAIPGERAPLGVESVGTAMMGGGDSNVPGANTEQQRRTSFKEMARRVQLMQKLRNTTPGDQTSVSSNDEVAMGHRRAHTLLASIDEAATRGDDGKQRHQAISDFATDIFSSDLQPPEDHQGLNFLWNEPHHPFRHATAVGEATKASQSSSVMTPSERRPLLSSNSPPPPDTAVVMEMRRLAQQRQSELRWKKVKRCINPIKLIEGLFYILYSGTFMISIPCFLLSAFLFYNVGNPELDFLPGQATVSWWLNFLGRQLLVLEIARFTEYILIDVLTMSSKAVVQMLGPWVTIFCLQSKGWPFLVAFWGAYDMILLHGNNPFQVHWLYWTGIRLYSQANSGSYILSSSVYLRVLIGMVLAGVATTLKRTVLTLYFGKRSFDVYKPKLEEILNDIIVITEIAELGAEADNLPDATGTQMNAKELVEDNLKKRGRFAEVRWSSVKFQNRSRADSDGSSIFVEKGDNINSGDISPWPELPRKVAPGTPPRSFIARNGATPSKSSGLIRIKNLLDRWDEPVNKLDKNKESTVNDILKFRKALTYMDLEHPFGVAFGPASTRDELIQSAQNLYQRLLKLAPGYYGLPYTVLAVLSDNGDGTVDKNLKKSIETLFRADADGEIPILTFIQSCDVVYRKLRYFRASVGNASVIDKVLENIINGIYNFGLTIVMLSLLNFNPWPLLVSVSTLLVSFAFAIGPTAAKSIEGILLIVGTRPFDIGDRIIIANTSGEPTPGVSNSWFVEDISLFSTTLRLASNNEVATVSNAAISAARITNCARSKNAVVDLLLKLHISIHAGQNVEKFKDGLENYVSDNPAVWDSLIYFRCEQIDSDDEFVVYHLAVRSCHSWQVAARVLADRGRLHQFCIELAKTLEVHFDSPTARRVFYYGGNLVDGAVKDFKKNLLMDRNNIRHGDFFNSAQDPAGLHVPPPVTRSTTLDGEAHTPSGNSNVDDIFLSMLQESHQ